MKKVAQSANKLKDKREAIAKRKETAAETHSQELVVVADDSSVVSALSNVLSEGGSLQAGSVVGSIKSGARDSDSEISILQRKYAGTVEKFVLETCTVMVFVSLEGKLTEYPLKYRITTYSDLQREISRIRPKSRIMYIIQDISGAPISAKHFAGYDLVRVKEISTRPLPSMLKNLPVDWEQNRYHAVAESREDTDADDGFSFASHQSDLD
jgi:hypothetical protein